MIDNPKFNDNRLYNYENDSEQFRAEYDYIIKWVDIGSKVLDLGCGNGSLLKKLVEQRNVKAYGLEISPTGVEHCQKKGLNVQIGNIDQNLPFEDNYFDFSICNVTMQMIMYPEILLSEMKRVSKYQIVSFPNFAFYKNRIQLLLKGKMPTHLLFGYSWYNTGHIHQFSIKDFLSLINEMGGIEVISSEYVKTKSVFINLLMKNFPNLFQYIAIYLLKKTDD